ncbi:Hsp70 family protein [Mycobacterium sp.]|jgi:hypothetical protein|uniref:Hsp70 family protein n=1 Tax=Mycobacterium sp. TaxID=1785 RepID=UPI002D4662EC|nr:Hsp70 family protein [Mycobacterium sp.]HZA08474.1 Hsp70 family protein [Mycobacterium sp.]
MAETVGLSVGATNLAAVVPGRAVVTRKSVLTLFRHRQPEVGVPSENPNLDERGLVVSGFVDRVGDPVGIVASDGSTHRGEVLLADALRALLYAATDGRPPAEPPTVTHPTHWRPASVEALGRALSALPEWSRGTNPAAPLSDATAALTALRDNPGVPARGVIALCDFGGTGTSITLADAANGFQPVGPTVRHVDFSGDLVDQALLRHVIADLSSAGSVDVSGTSAIGSLNRLRAECRAAKERLSGATVTSLVADLPGSRSDIRLTRNELEDEIRPPLEECIAVVRDTMDRSGIRPADLVAVAAVGGGANIPAVITTLSEHLRVPVITAPRPELAAATGAALRGGRGPADEGATALAAAAPLAAVPYAGEPSGTFRALAWSEADDETEDFTDYAGDYSGDYPTAGGATGARPLVEFEQPEGDAYEEAQAKPRWYRRPLPVIGALLAVLLLCAVIAFMALRHGTSPTSVTTTTTPTPAPTVAPTTPPPATEAPAPVEPQAPKTRTVTVPPPAPSTQAPPAAPPPAAPPPSTETPTSEAPAPTTQPPSTTQGPLIPTIPPIPTIPGLPPFIPQPQAPAGP